MTDDEIEQAGGDAVGICQSEQAAELDAVRHQEIDGRQAEQHAKREGQDRNVDVVRHDHAGHQRAFVRRDLGPELMVVHELHEFRRHQRVGQLWVEGDGDKGHQRRTEEKHGRRDQVGRRFPIGLREGLPVEAGDPLAQVAALPVNGGVAPGNQPVEVTRHRLGRPVPLRPGEVRRRPAIERRECQDLGGAQASDPAGSGSRQEFFQPVPLGSPAGHEFVSTHVIHDDGHRRFRPACRRTATRYREIGA